MLTIIIHPNSVLRARAAKIHDVLSPDIQNLAKEMVDTMRSADGVGLAAPQVGKSIRLCIIRESCIDYAKISANKKKQIQNLVQSDNDLILINPRIVDRSKELAWGEEGCLSIPGVFGEVERSLEIAVASISSLGEDLFFNASNFFARVIQHEVDHLDGILFIDKARNIKIDKNYVPQYRRDFAV